jgi:hypothetical protein
VAPKGGDRFESFVEHRRVVTERVNHGKLGATAADWTRMPSSTFRFVTSA